MNYETPAARVHLIDSLRVAVNFMQDKGVPRHVLFDVMSTMVRELAAKTDSEPKSERACGGKRFEMITSELTRADKRESEIDGTLEAMKMLHPAIVGVTGQYGAGILLSALTSHLATLLLQYKDRGKDGAAITQSVMDSLMQTVKTGRSHVSEIRVQDEH